ncbi:MAG: tetratricopeptide repeat protein [Anaerolineae bacterium]|nr:tetratricopeptide repeat protein [Anaerolineae bacterium]
MYLSRRRRRRSNPWRVFLILLLIGVALYTWQQVQPPQIEISVLPSPTPTRAPQAYHTEADGYYWEGDLRNAIATYQRALQIFPHDVSFYAPMVRLLVLDGQPLKAVQQGEQAVAIDPNSAPAWATLCLAYDWVGWIQDALDACDRALVLDPTYAGAYAYMAEAYTDSGQWNAALEAARTAQKLDPRSVDALRAYGYALEMMGNYSGAIEYYQKALEIHPKLAYLYLDIGRNQQALLNTPGAITAFRRAVELAPYRADALAQLGWVYYAIEEYREARQYLEKAIEADSEYATAYGRLATVYWTQRNYESAIPHFEKAIKMAYRASRRATRGFYVTVEPVQNAYTYPTLARKILEGRFRATDNTLTHFSASLNPTDRTGAWATARGQVAMNALTGEVTLALEQMPDPPVGQVYVGWFSGLRTLADTPLNTGPLWVASDGTVMATLKAEPVKGPRIEYFYTLGLCYYYMAQCEQAYPLFDTALQIDPNDPNAQEGIRLCRESEASSTP